MKERVGAVNVTLTKESDLACQHITQCFEQNLLYLEVWLTVNFFCTSNPTDMTSNVETTAMLHNTDGSRQLPNLFRTEDLPKTCCTRQPKTAKRTAYARKLRHTLRPSSARLCSALVQPNTIFFRGHMERGRGGPRESREAPRGEKRKPRKTR